MTSLHELLDLLAEISGQPRVPPDVRLADIGIDSMDILQWLFEVEEQLGIELDDLLDDESTELEAFGDVTMSELYAVFESLAEKAHKGAS